jgi:hypothetical protein
VGACLQYPTKHATLHFSRLTAGELSEVYKTLGKVKEKNV